jgi:hypothetical protein
MFIVNPAKMKKVTLALLGLIVSGTITGQMKWIEDHVDPLLLHHPHLAWLGSGLVLVVTALHNPRAAQLIEQLAMEQQTANPDGSTTKTATQVTVEKPQ